MRIALNKISKQDYVQQSTECCSAQINNHIQLNFLSFCFAKQVCDYHIIQKILTKLSLM